MNNLSAILTVIPMVVILLAIQLNIKNKLIYIACAIIFLIGLFIDPDWLIYIYPN